MTTWREASKHPANSLRRVPGGHQFGDPAAFHDKPARGILGVYCQRGP